MSLTVQLYKWHKRVNSTKLPGVADPHTDFSCTLKEPTSIHNPVIILATNDCDFTYAHISAWSRYYFVEDVVYVHNGLVEYHLTEDYLGSNKLSIGSTVANIAYASDHYNSFIVDPRIKVSTSKYIQSDTAKDAGASSVIFNDIGLYMVTIFDSANQPSANGMASVYIMDGSIMQAFKNWMSDPSVMSALSTYFNGDPLSAIYSIKYIPYRSFGASLTDVTGFIIGNSIIFSTTVMAGEVFKRVNSHGIYHNTYSVGHHFKYSDFRRCQPYTTGTMFLPGVGCIDINPSDFVSSDKIYIEVFRDDVTGDVIYRIKTQSGEIIQTAACNVAFDVPYGRVTTNSTGVATSIGGMAAAVGGLLVGAITGNMALGLGGAATGLASAANMALSSNQHGTSIVGGSGSRIGTYHGYIVYTEIAVDTEDPTNANYIARFGRAVCETHAINTHSGYVQTIGASVSLDADKEEIETVNRMLDAGIYYE